MLQILRLSKPGIITCSRCYATQRSTGKSNHYETLQISPDCSQKEIREAFLKLSKEVHPDISGKTSHADFVKINEAYNVLGKEHSRKQYDNSLQHNHSYEWYSHDGFSTTRPDYWKMGPKPGPIDNESDNYYGVKGIRRVSNLTVALLCLVLSTFGLAIQMITIQKSLVFKREALLARSSLYQKEYNELRKSIENTSFEEQLDIFKKRVEARKNGGN